MTLFDRIFRLLLVILPFHVLLSVFLEYKVDIPGVALYKEVALVALFGLYGWAIFQKKISIPVLDRLDYLMIAYVVWMVGVTVFQGLSIANILYGGRYDFIFFAMFFIIRK